jgi:hypothetical protein
VDEDRRLERTNLLTPHAMRIELRPLNFERGERNAGTPAEGTLLVEIVALPMTAVVVK